MKYLASLDLPRTIKSDILPEFRVIGLLVICRDGLG